MLIIVCRRRLDWSFSSKTYDQFSYPSLICFYLDFMAHQDYSTHFQLWGENGIASRKTTWPATSRIWLVYVIGLKRRQWDDERFRVLKISCLNHQAMGAAPSLLKMAQKQNNRNRYESQEPDWLCSKWVKKKSWNHQSIKSQTIM